MTIITPGIDFLILNLLKLSLPPSLLTFLFRTLSKRYSLPFKILPTWCIASGSLLAFLVLVVLKMWLKVVRDRRKARKLGARLPPVIEAKWPGAIDVMNHFNRPKKICYPGSCFHSAMAVFAPLTFGLILDIFSGHLGSHH
jgi:hypothetical protein